MKLMQPLVQNQNNLDLLASLLKRLDLHQELAAKDRRFNWNYVPFKVHALLGMQRIFTETNKESVSHCKRVLMQEAYSLAKELNLKYIA
jgi:hypothetical protein